MRRSSRGPSRLSSVYLIAPHERQQVGRAEARRSAPSLLRLQDLDEGFLGDVDLADAFHTFFAFFLFLLQFAFASDIAAVAFRGDVFSQRGNTFPRNNFPADGGLDRDLVKLARDDFL